MNRRHRRQMEKTLGILKYKKSLSLADRMKRSTENNALMLDNNRRKNQEAEDLKSSAEISSMATTIMIQDGLSYVDALSKATHLYKNKNEI